MIKLFFMLNSSKNEICFAYKKLNTKTLNFFSCTTELSIKFFLLINIKMPTTVGILIFMSRKNFMLKWVEHEKSFITSSHKEFAPQGAKSFDQTLTETKHISVRTDSLQAYSFPLKLQGDQMFFLSEKHISWICLIKLFRTQKLIYNVRVLWQSR